MSKKRLRVIKMIVQPVVMVDDGENLTEIQVQPIAVPFAKWTEFAQGGMDDALAALRKELGLK